jgi:serine/threonine protein kinase
MGLVYRAYHTGLERTVAVKVLQAITPDKDTVARFRHEAQAIARLRHPNIVDVYDVGEFEGTPYMVVEYVSGGSLAGKMSPGGIGPAAALRYLRGIAAGLDYAHGRGIVHRDVKPANVLLTDDGSPVLADFGLAKLLQGTSLKSMTGVTTGTPAYMAPEQVTGHDVGPAADRYSLASMAYEMLTGVIPFDGEGLMEVLYAQVHRYPSPPSARHSALGPEVDAAIMRGLAKDPSMRWESCTAFVEALAQALERPAAVAVAPTMVMAPPLKTAPMLRQPLPATVAVALPEAPPQPSGPAGRRLDRRLLAIAAVLIVLLTFGVCAVVAQATTLSVNPDFVAPGSTVTVTAGHVPANKAGEIQLLSAFYRFPFRADSHGDVRQDITVPAEIELGEHTVRICWDGSCHKDAPLHVVSGVAQASPSAGGSPSAGASASPSGSPGGSPRSTPSPGSTPRSTSNPTSTPKASPTATPKSSPPPPSPTPTSNPCPTSPSSAYLTATGGSVLTPAVTVTGHNFVPGNAVTVRWYFPAASTTPEKTVFGNVQCDGTFTVSFTPNTLDVGTGRIVANDGVRSASLNYSVS